MSDDYGYIPPTGDRTVSFKGIPGKAAGEKYRGEVLAHLEAHETVRPLGGMVLIELDEADVFYEGTNILMPQEYRDVSEHGTVRAVGEGRYVGGDPETGVGCRHYPLTLKPGDRVRLHRWNMTEVMIGGKLHVIMPEKDVHYVEEGDEP